MQPTGQGATPVRTLIIDDDPLSRRRIRALLDADPEIELAGECADGVQGVAGIRAERPDLVFLDVQMPGLDGFGVVETIGPERMPVVVFASAHVEFALRAFEAYALDYLLKPFDDERFQAALERAKRQVRMQAGGMDSRLLAMMQFLQQPRKPQFPEVLAIKTGGQYPLVRVEDIDYIEADGNYARLHVQKTPRLLNKTLTELENKLLDPSRFVRIHRSTIVNLSRIVSMEPLFHGELSVVLRDGTRLVCSRRYRQNLQEHVYFTS
ncbi:MAG TPA: LytTR family DNA-binding domain-containing protein [Longimicrobiaceae bacterium]|jgi:two-component system LytT family response regulator